MKIKNNLNIFSILRHFINIILRDCWWKHFFLFCSEKSWIVEIYFYPPFIISVIQDIFHFHEWILNGKPRETFLQCFLKLFHCWAFKCVSYVFLNSFRWFWWVSFDFFEFVRFLNIYSIYFDDYFYLFVHCILLWTVCKIFTWKRSNKSCNKNSQFLNK